MAQRRMFSRKITESDQFLDMSMSAQVLYFHINMQADDDGFVGNAKMIKRMIGASDDDLKLLIAKEFLIPFETGIVVIRDWKIHNYIRKDRYTETFYKAEKAQIEFNSNDQYEWSTNGLPNDIPMVDQRLPQVRLGKDRLELDKDNIDQSSADSEQLNILSIESDVKVPQNQIKENFEKLWKLYPRKERKQDAIKAYRKAIKNGVTNKQIQDGIINYKKKLEAEGTEHQFIAQGGTWFNQQRWNDEYVISKPKPNYSRGSKHKEIIPSWLQDQRDNKETNPQPVDDEDNQMSEEDIRAWLDELEGDGTDS